MIFKQQSFYTPPVVYDKRFHYVIDFVACLRRAHKKHMKMMGHANTSIIIQRGLNIPCSYILCERITCFNPLGGDNNVATIIFVMMLMMIMMMELKDLFFQVEKKVKMCS